MIYTANGYLYQGAGGPAGQGIFNPGPIAVSNGQGGWNPLTADQAKNVNSVGGFGSTPLAQAVRGAPDPFSGSGNFSGLQGLLSNMPTFKPITAPGAVAVPDAYKAKDMSNVDLPQYDAMRTRLNTQYSQTQAQAQDALDRQFAAMGGGPGSGVQAKQTENLAGKIAEQKGQDLEAINAQEAAQRTQLQQLEAQKEFQSGEAQKGYQFQAAETQAQQSLQTQMFNQQMQQDMARFGFQAGSTIASLQANYNQQKMDQFNSAFNAAMEEQKNGSSVPISQLMQQFLETGQGGGFYG